MADDIVTRLRDAEDNGICEWQVLIDAADEIEELRKRVAELEAIIEERRQAWQEFWAVHGNGR